MLDVGVEHVSAVTALVQAYRPEVVWRFCEQAVVTRLILGLQELVRHLLHVLGMLCPGLVQWVDPRHLATAASAGLQVAARAA